MGFFWRLLRFVAIIAIGVAIAVYLRTGSLEPFKRAASKVDTKEEIKDTIGDLGQAIKREIVNPGPLISKIQSARVNLTHEGVVTWTNTARNDNGSLPPLKVNSKLDEIAQERLKDMFQKQYFEHINPQGVGASDIAKEIGYDYLVIGENIALGNFATDEVLVDAWMNSPGHRANILNNRYTEIGVAVGKGVYDGRTTWIGVQIFGKPANDCPKIPADAKTNLDLTKANLNDLKAQLDALRLQMDQMRASQSFNRDEYNRMVEQYNSLVNRYNAAASTYKQQISSYNNLVSAYNICIAK